MNDAKPEIRVTANGMQVISVESGRVLQEDFEHGCLRCPVCGKTVSVGTVVAVVEAARRELRILLQTLREASAVEAR